MVCSRGSRISRLKNSSRWSERQAVEDGFLKGGGGPGMKMWAHKRASASGTQRPTRKETHIAPPKSLHAVALPSLHSQVGLRGLVPPNLTSCPCGGSVVRTQAPSRSPGLVPLSPHHVKSTIKRGKSKREQNCKV